MKLLSLLFLFSMVSNADVHEFDLPAGEVAIHNDRGTTEIVGVPGNKITFEFEKVRWNKDCALSVTKEPQQLVVRSVQSRGGFWFMGCEVNLKIGVPAGVKSQIFSDAGDVLVKNLKGDLGFEIGSGDLRVENSVVPFVKGMTGSGDLKLDGQFFDINLQSGSGDVSTAFHTLSGREKLDVNSGSGDIDVLVPAESTLSLEFLSGTGKLKSSVREAGRSGLKISVKTGSGDLKIDHI